MLSLVLDTLWTAVVRVLWKGWGVVWKSVGFPFPPSPPVAPQSVLLLHF